VVGIRREIAIDNRENVTKGRRRRARSSFPYVSNEDAQSITSDYNEFDVD
jgi:hypothetical protein